MKKQILLFLTLVLSIVASAQVTIQMEKEGGVYKVPCTVNGVKMKFIFDTGASTVCISQSMAQFLLDGEYLSVDDIVGTGQSQVADGSVVNHVEIILRDIEIGGMHIHNVEATVIEGQNAPLLLGQTAISELGKISIEGNNLVIHAIKTNYSNAEIEKIRQDVKRLIKTESYVAAIDYYLIIDDAVGLSEEELFSLIYCCLNAHHLDQCIQMCKRWLAENQNLFNKHRQLVYDCLAHSYYHAHSDFDNCIKYVQKSLDMLNDPAMSALWSDKERRGYIAMDQYCLGNCYNSLGRVLEAMKYYNLAINECCKYLSISLEEVKYGNVKNDYLGMYLYYYSLCYYNRGDYKEGNNYMKLSALCGYEFANDYCRQHRIEIK